MMTQRFSLGAVALLLALLAATPSFAQRGGRGGGMGPGGMGPGGMGPRAEMGQCMVDELGLSEAQVAQIKTIREAFRTSHADEMEAMQTLQTQMREARRSGDNAKFEELRARMQQLGEALRADRDKMHEDVMAVLTPAQRAKFDAAREKCNDGKGQGKGKGKGKGKGRHGDCDGSGQQGGRSQGQTGAQKPKID